MARNTTTATTETSSTATSGAKKRRFGVNTANIPTAAPTIVPGIYVGTLKNVKADAVDRQSSAIQGIENINLFDVVEKLEWTKEKNEAGKSDAVHTGEFYIQGALTYAVELANETGVQDLPMDTMTIFGGRVNIFFAKDEEGNWGLDTSSDDFGVVNRTWRGFQTATGLTDDDINEILEATPFDEDEEVEIPERLEALPDAKELVQAALFYRTFFTLVAERVNGQPIKVNVAQRNRYNSEDLENVINVGFNKKGFASYNSSGLIPLEV